jgi:transposase
VRRRRPSPLPGVATKRRRPHDCSGGHRRLGGQPVSDPITYKGRNVIERSFNDHKQWRGIATRYDKLATVYRGAVVLRAITMRLTT